MRRRSSLLRRPWGDVVLGGLGEAAAGPPPSLCQPLVLKGLLGKALLALAQEGPEADTTDTAVLSFGQRQGCRSGDGLIPIVDHRQALAEGWNP